VFISPLRYPALRFTGSAKSLLSIQRVRIYVHIFVYCVGDGYFINSFVQLSKPPKSFKLQILGGQYPIKRIEDEIDCYDVVLYHAVLVMAREDGRSVMLITLCSRNPLVWFSFRGSNPLSEFFCHICHLVQENFRIWLSSSFTIHHYTLSPFETWCNISNTVEPCNNVVGLCDISFIASDILRCQLIPHC
jgi:hypothetical protein